jgi:hypothetical protein
MYRSCDPAAVGLSVMRPLGALAIYLAAVSSFRIFSYRLISLGVGFSYLVFSG